MRHFTALCYVPVELYIDFHAPETLSFSGEV